MKKGKKGFTLIELLVVISIIAVLSSILFSSFAVARKQAAYSIATSDIQSMQQALELYYEDHNDWPPDNAIFSALSCTIGWDTLGNYLKPYIASIPYPKYPTSPSLPTACYSYYKGTAGTTLHIPIYNGLTGIQVACILLNDGYYMDFAMPQQNSLTLNGGVDPDGIEAFSGAYRNDPVLSDCPGIMVTYTSP